MTAATLLRELDQRMSAAPWRVDETEWYNGRGCKIRSDDALNALIAELWPHGRADEFMNAEALARFRNALPAVADALEAAEATTGTDSTEDWEAVDAKALRSLRSALAVVAAQLQGERA